MTAFRAYMVEQDGQTHRSGVRELTLDQLPEGDVLIRVRYSSVNYKDGICSQPASRLVTRYPMVLGIDLAGEVVESRDARFRPGDAVICTSYDLGTGHFGGFSEYARVPADWVVPLPDGLSLRDAMVLGTAGFTAALSLYRMEQNGVSPAMGTLLVTGATGGVGATGIAIAKRAGYRVVASTRKGEARAWLTALGADDVVHPDALFLQEGESYLNARTRYAGVIDPVSGKYVPHLLQRLEYGGVIAISGYTGGPDFTASVFPFLRRQAAIIGIDSVWLDMQTRREIWSRLAGPWKPSEDALRHIGHDIRLDDLDSALRQILAGQMQGRAVVNL
ncbi:acrylyl-CoA reductase family protein [Alicyclobacillus sendaiensis]|uniref:acrylyl-CoA reductase family protein n=1 Tax=Alicyclobacillus sendaiensis TaxID=192387 RepID=UPI0026F443D1|nr:acryloyl-CoA reductase [Alicyclobacillus sendaiensis]